MTTLPNPNLDAPADTPAEPRHRSGTAARLAGLPAATLRVWERRYGVVAAPKSESGQRLYSRHDVQRLTLIKQLVDRGHAIGTVALLSLAQLAELARTAAPVPPAASLDRPLLRPSGHAAPSGPLAGAARAMNAEPAAQAVQTVVVGRSLASRLQRRGYAHLVLAHVLDELDAVPALQPPKAIDLLIVHTASLMPESAHRVMVAASALKPGRVVVLYGFGAQGVVDSLYAAGVTIRREPISDRELDAVIAGPALQAAAVSAVPLWGDHPRRYDDDALLALAAISPTIACECPRHLAEIVLQLSSFERYSAECADRGPADALLHQHLRNVTAAARSLFESALERVAMAEGLNLPMPAAASG